MADSDAKATFSIDLEGSAKEVSDELAASLETLRGRISGSEDAVKGMSSALRRLKGNTADVKSAKEQLKAKIDAERAAISAGNLQLLKQGVTYDQLTAKAKKLAIEKEKAAKKKEARDLEQVRARMLAMANATQFAGGPVSNLTGSLGTLSGVVEGLGTGMSALVIGVVGAVAVLALLTAGVVAAGVAFAKFVIAGSNAARTANLLREATTGSAENAANLGTQVDALAGKVSASKDELNQLAVSLARNRMSGQAIVDTFNAVGQASDAMGNEVGNKLRGLLERGQISQRFAINPLELLGTGLNFDDVAKPLAKSMRVGIKEARAALFEGRVSLDAGAKALRDAVEKRFAEVNARKLLDINVQVAKFREKLDALTKGVDLEPLLGAVSHFFSLFDESTFTGTVLKQIVTILGTEMVGALKAVAPIGEGLFKGLVIASLKLIIGVLKVKKAFTDTFGDTNLLGNVTLINGAVLAGKVAIYGLVAGFALLAAGVAVVAAPLLLAAAAFAAISLAAHEAYEFVTGLSWKDLGKSLIDGFVNGITGGVDTVIAAVEGLAGSAKDALTGSLKIASPSKVFAQYGANTAEGFAAGVDRGAPRAQGAVDSMAPTAPAVTSAPSGGGAARGGDVTVNVNIMLEGGKGGGGEAAAQLTGPAFETELTRVLEEVLLSVGLLPRATA